MPNRTKQAHHAERGRPPFRGGPATAPAVIHRECAAGSRRPASGVAPAMTLTAAVAGRWPGSARVARLPLLLLLLACVACSGHVEPVLVPSEPDASPPHSTTLEVAGRKIEVELAYTQEARTKGLMHRPALDPDCGMLFLFPTSQPRRFWMRNTLIPLDIAFLDEQGVVLNIEHGRPGVERPGYFSRKAAQFVLEMADGWCAAAGLEPGAKLEISPALRALAEPEAIGG